MKTKNSPVTIQAKEVQKRGRPRKHKPSQVANGLTIPEKIFVNKYIETKGNGTEAYQQAHPNASRETSNVEAVRVLSKPSVREAINTALAELELTTSYILGGFKDSHELYKLSEPNASIRALENIASIADLYPHKNTELELSDGTLKIKWEE